MIRREDLEQRALAGAVAPDDADDLAGLDVEGDVAQRPEPAFVPRPLKRRIRRMGAFAKLTSISRNDPSRDGRTPSWYRFEIRSTRTAGVTNAYRTSQVHRVHEVHEVEGSREPGVRGVHEVARVLNLCTHPGRRTLFNQIGHATLDTAEERRPSQAPAIETTHDHDRRPGERKAQNRGPESVDHADERIQVEQPPPLRWYQAERINHRRREHPQLQQERDDLPDVPGHRAQRRQRGAHSSR